MIPIDVAPRLDTPNAQKLAAQIKRQWREGHTDPDAAAILADHSVLARYKSIVLDLAYEEYCLREEAGATPDAGAFCARFGSFRGSLRKVIEAHRLVADHPELLTAPPVEWPAAGETFEGLELAGELGRGAFGRAYAAYDPQTGRPCVLKLALGRSAEAQVIGGLRHPNVIEVYWARLVGRFSAVCMPFVGTTTLDEARETAFADGTPTTSDKFLAAIDPGSGPTEVGPAIVRAGESYTVGVAAVLQRVADALAYLHRSGVAHGDLKPSNVVLGPGGRPHLIDFNLSVADEQQDSVPGGTLPYMAPELLRAVAEGVRPAGLSAAKADLYAFGVTAFELLTGKPLTELPKPDKAPAAAAELLKRLAGPTPRVRDLAPTVPAVVARLIDRCLAADPTARPEAADVAATLDRFLYATRNRRSRWRRRGLAALVCLVGGSALAGWTLRPSTPLPPVQSIAREPETAEEFFERGLKFLHAGQYPSACGDFSTSRRLKETPQSLAYISYCMGLMGQSMGAEALGRRAIEKGASGAAVRNNVGYNLSETGHPEQAIPYLEEAVRMAPDMRQARYNLIVARLRAAQKNNRVGPDPTSLANIDAVLNLGPPSFPVLYLAAAIYAMNMPLSPDNRAKAIQCLVLAVRKGVNPKRFAVDGVLGTYLRDDPEFRQILLMTPGPLEPANDEWQVEPIGS